MLCFCIAYKFLVGLGFTTIRVNNSVGKVPSDFGNSDFLREVFINRFTLAYVVNGCIGYQFWCYNFGSCCGKKNHRKPLLCNLWNVHRHPLRCAFRGWRADGGSRSRWAQACLSIVGHPWGCYGTGWRRVSCTLHPQCCVCLSIIGHPRCWDRTGWIRGSWTLHPRFWDSTVFYSGRDVCNSFLYWIPMGGNKFDC